MTVIYSSKRINGLPGWNTYDQTGHMIPVGTQILDGSQMWDDPNHIKPGEGWVNLIAFGYKQGSGISNSNLPLMDLRNKKFVIDIEMENMGRQGKGAIGLWVQGSSPYGLRGKMLNLFQKQNLVCGPFGLIHPKDNPHSLTGFTPPRRETVTIPFSDNPSCWASMGSSVDRSDLYGHWENPSVDLDKILNCGWVDFGIIVLQPNQSPHFYGLIKIHEIRIEE